MTKVIIEVENGEITAVFSNNSDVEYVIVDKDAISNGDKPVKGVYDLDGYYSELIDMYSDGDPVDTEIREELKRLKF